MESLARQLHFEQCKRIIRGAGHGNLDELKSIALMLLEQWTAAHGFSARAAWKLGEMEREIGDLRRKLVELQASEVSIGPRAAHGGTEGTEQPDRLQA